jgi:imidazolonepropionase
MKKLKLLGPFSQLITMAGLPRKGAMSDNQMEIIEHAGLLLSDEIIETVGPFRELSSLGAEVERIEENMVAMPGFLDVHTHICWAGSRAGDYALRLSGKSYTDIAGEFGGIWSTVTKTRASGIPDLAASVSLRAERMLHQGITTLEVKSGYGLSFEAEIKILEAIQTARDSARIDLVPTCLAAHIKPVDFVGSELEYLEYMAKDLLPTVKTRGLSNRVDIYVDEGAFKVRDARYYLLEANKMGFDLVVHADQFSRGGSALAVELGAKSADHLEVVSEEDIRLLAASNVASVALPGSSLGLGVAFAPVRRLLDAGALVVIASDWNPGTAPMGNLLMQSAVLGVYERLTMAETLAAVTCRAAEALGLDNRGILQPGMLADIIAFPCHDYREILYNQGAMHPAVVWKRGERVEE